MKFTKTVLLSCDNCVSCSITYDLELEYSLDEEMLGIHCVQVSLNSDQYCRTLLYRISSLVLQLDEQVTFLSPWIKVVQSDRCNKGPL